MMLAACTPQAGASPTPSAAKVSAPTSPTAEATPILGDGVALSLSAIQRLNQNVGYIAGWTGTGLGLAKTSDGGATWQRLPIPADHLTALRFIDEHVGWAAGFLGRNVAQIACSQAAAPGTQPCKGLVLRTQDGGKTWQTVLAIPTDAVYGEPIRQIQAVDGERAWAVSLDQSPCQSLCPSFLQRTTDGGRSWTTQLHGEIATIRFASATRGWLALGLGAGGANVGPGGILKTDDGGRTWRCATTPPNTSLLSVADPLDVWASGEDRVTQSSALYTTEDAGTTWHRLDLSSLR